MLQVDRYFPAYFGVFFRIFLRCLSLATGAGGHTSTAVTRAVSLVFSSRSMAPLSRKAKFVKVTFVHYISRTLLKLFILRHSIFSRRCALRIMFSIVVVQRYSCLSNTTVDSLIEHAVKITLKQSACQQSKNSQKSIIIIYCEIVIHFLGTRFEYLPVVQWITTASIQAVPWFALRALYMWLVER